ncbi:MAG: ribulose-phosphate 3-epimerase, partial [Oscillospiraceae bacterium]
MKNFNLSIDETLIAPSILSADFSRLGEEVALIGLTKSKLLHIDVMDGCFVPNISFGSVVMKSIRNQSDLIFDVHLMINHPLLYIKDFVEAGADIITFHLECEDNTLEVINKIKSYGVKVGISIKPKTKADEVFKYLSLVDMVLVMTVEPGFGGQSFMEAQMPKIK